MQVLNLLTEKEVKLVLPSHAIVPRTFILKPGMVLFLAALGRIDYLQVREERILGAAASSLTVVPAIKGFLGSFPRPLHCCFGDDQSVPESLHEVRMPWDG